MGSKSKNKVVSSGGIETLTIFKLWLNREELEAESFTSRMIKASLLTSLMRLRPFLVTTLGKIM